LALRQGLLTSKKLVLSKQYLTRDLMRELDLFQHDQQGSDLGIGKISDKKGWKQVRRGTDCQCGHKSSAGYLYY